VTEIKRLSYTFPKTERLHKKILLQELFDNGSSFYLYPFKLIWHSLEKDNGPQVMFSVPKRTFKKAVTRNHIKRQLREAYRLNKHCYFNIQRSEPLMIAFIYVGKDLLEFKVINAKLEKALKRLSTELNK
jgi:ribonuclease P protein component